MGMITGRVQRMKIYDSIWKSPTAHLVLKDRFGEKITLEFSESEQKFLDSGKWADISGEGHFLAKFTNENNILEYDESHQYHMCWLDDKTSAESFGAEIIAIWVDKL